MWTEAWSLRVGTACPAGLQGVGQKGQEAAMPALGGQEVTVTASSSSKGSGICSHRQWEK